MAWYVIGYVDRFFRGYSASIADRKLSSTSLAIVTHLSNRLSISFLPAKQTTLKSMADAVKRGLPKGLSK